MHACKHSGLLALVAGISGAVNTFITSTHKPLTASLPSNPPLASPPASPASPPWPALALSFSCRITETGIHMLHAGLHDCWSAGPSQHQRNILTQTITASLHHHKIEIKNKNTATHHHDHHGGHAVGWARQSGEQAGSCGGGGGGGAGNSEGRYVSAAQRLVGKCHAPLTPYPPTHPLLPASRTKGVPHTRAGTQVGRPGACE